MLELSPDCIRIWGSSSGISHWTILYTVHSLWWQIIQQVPRSNLHQIYQILCQKQLRRSTLQPCIWFQSINCVGWGKDQALATFWAAGAVSLQQAFQVTLQALVTHCTALHCTALHCTALHCTALRCTALRCAALHCTALHCTALYCIALYCNSIYFATKGAGLYLEWLNWNISSSSFSNAPSLPSSLSSF